MDIKEIKSEKNVATVEVKVNKAEIETHRDHVVDEMISQVTVKGFRQGKAPRAIAIEHLDPEKLTDHLLNHILNEAVTDIMNDKKYRLLGRPVLENIDTKDEKEWTININFPLYPEVKLGDYTKLFVKKTESKKSKTKETAGKPEKATDERLNDIYQALLNGIEVDIPASVVDEEVNYSLNRLANQAKTLNLSLEDYLKAVNKSLEQIKEEYSKNAVESLKLDLILLAIAKEQKIETTDEEVAKMAEVGQVPESQVGQLRAILSRRKTIEYLSSL
ncbi:MAG TPA: trigger factor [Patescibacteria group bacterium]